MSTPIENRNFLAPVGFVFTIDRIKKVSYFCNQANIPELTLGVAEQANYLRNIPVPGDKIEFGDLNIRFLIDEDMTNYMQIQRWIRGLGFPDSLKEFDDLETQRTLPNNVTGRRRFAQDGDQIYSDGSIQILNSNNIPSFQVNFKDLFPYNLSTITFDSTDTDIEYFTADVSFKYVSYDITDATGNPI